MSDTRKISTKIWRPVLEKLDEKINAACLRRDAYLSKLLRNEVEWLDSEVSIPNAEDALAFISRRLDNLDRKLVTLTLDSVVVDHLNEVCSRKRINRDSFFNRLFLLLASSSRFIDRVFFPGMEDWRQEVWSEHRNEGPFFQNSFYPLEQEIDPFWAIRMGLEIGNESEDSIDYVEPESGETIRAVKDYEGNISPVTSLYTLILSDKELKDTDLYGLNTYIPTWLIPGHPAHDAYANRLDDLFAAL